MSELPKFTTGNDGELYGEYPDPNVAALIRTEIGHESEIAFLAHLREQMPNSEIMVIIKDIMQAGHYTEVGKNLMLSKFWNFIAHHGDNQTAFKDQLEKAYAKNADQEATFGYATFGGQRCVLFAGNWGFMGGSVGEVVGAKYWAAAELAMHDKLPFVNLDASGGMRQQEGAYAVVQMPRGVFVLRDYQEATKLLSVSVLIGKIFGGETASIALTTDVVIGIKDSDLGFAGPEVIKNNQGRAVRPGVQSVEANLINRYVDVVANKDEVVELLAQTLKTNRPPESKSLKHRITVEGAEAEWQLLHNDPSTRTIYKGEDGLAPPLRRQQHRRALRTIEVPNPRLPLKSDDLASRLMDNYNRLASDVGRIDGEFLLRTLFDESVPMHNHYWQGGRIIYPPIIGGIGRIQDQKFMFVANQFSLELRSSGYLKKILASPGPRDYRWYIKMLERAARMELPVISAVDTLGASPTEQAELDGQSEWIARAIDATNRYKFPFITVATGAIGSGGGIAMTRMAPRLLALDDAMVFVAEPSSMMSILNKTSAPSPDDVKRTLPSMEASAEVLHKLGFIHRLIATSNDPYETVHNIRQAVVEEYLEQAALSPEKLRKMTRELLKLTQRAEMKEKKPKE